MSFLCRRCGEAIEWRVSKAGRRYPVNGDGPRKGQLHSYDCKNKEPKVVPADPNTPKGEEGAVEYDSLKQIEDMMAAMIKDGAMKEAPAGIQKAAEGWAIPAQPGKGDDDNMPEPPPDDPDAKIETLAEIIAKHCQPFLADAITGNVDMDVIRKMIREEGTKKLVVSVRGKDTQDIDVTGQHMLFPVLLFVMGRRRNIWLAGPAGSGKTTACHKAAEALKLDFGAISVGPQTTQSALFGYMDAHGKYVPTEFRRRYQHGGVFLFDEIDRGNPGVLTALNQAIENGTCAFPDGMIIKHSDFIAVAAANTFGNGASREYVGALQLDAATLDRFVMLDWPYDENLETAIAMATYDAAGGKSQDVAVNWLAKVRAVRNKASELKMRVVISPRASIVGCDFLGAGMAVEMVQKLVLVKGLDVDAVKRLEL